MTTALEAPSDLEIVSLSEAELRAVIAQVGDEVVGERSFDRLRELHLRGQITGPGAGYLNSLLELAA